MMMLKSMCMMVLMLPMMLMVILRHPAQIAEDVLDQSGAPQL
jgi:hypothetical protein